MNGQLAAANNPAANQAAENQALVAQLKELGFQYIRDKDYSSAQFAFKKILELDKADINARMVYAQIIEDGSHKKRAESRDLMLSILDEHPAIFDIPTETNQNLIRAAAERCSHVGPFTKAIELYRKLAHASNNATDYYLLSEVLTQRNQFEEAISSLEKAIALDPAYGTKANRETLETARSQLNQANGLAAQSKKKVGRYPETEIFLGDFEKLVIDHIAADLRGEPRFINRNTRFFTMGSCFARNLSHGLRENGYASHHMEISEYINTTFANRALVDWLSDAPVDDAIRDRIAELLPTGWSKETTLQVLKHSNVFILTLGVAPAFFDRTNGDFVLPRKSSLNSRALAEKYIFRTTSVSENVDNVLYLINFIRKIVPDIKIIVTVSPVPLFASFEYESAVQADCLSKSTMRLVAHEVVNNSKLQNILYWPSFEVFRWAGSNSSNYYAADDGAAWHVSQEKVDGTIGAFIKMFADS